MLEIITPATIKWKLKELSILVDEIENDVSDFVSIHQIKTEQDYINLTLQILGKCIRTLREIISLSSFGYPDGALSLSRNIYEQLILISFFETISLLPDFQEYIDDYYLDYDYQANKCLQLENRYFTLDKSKQQRINQDKNRILSQAHYKPKGLYWWARKSSFKDLIDHVKSNQDASLTPLLNELHLEYKRACLSLHSNCFGNIVRLGFKSETNIIDNSPTINGHGLPLWIATASFIMVVGISSKVLGLDYQKYKQVLNDTAFFYKEMGISETSEEE